MGASDTGRGRVGVPAGRGHRVRWWSIAVLGVVVVLSHGACSGDGDDRSDGSETSTTQSSRTSTSERFPHPVSLTAKVPIIDQASGERVGTIAVLIVSVDYECPNPAALPPENGHFLAVQFSLEVDADATIELSGRGFRIESPDGETQDNVATTAAALSCDPPRGQDPLANVRPGEAYIGPMILDSAFPSGSLVFTSTGPGTEIRWTF